jgi:Glutathione S-transferase, C-terminal domain/IstB-like ATP binding protein
MASAGNIGARLRAPATLARRTSRSSRTANNLFGGSVYRVPAMTTEPARRQCPAPTSRSRSWPRSPIASRCPSSPLATALLLAKQPNASTRFAEQSDKEGWPAARFLAAIAEHELAERGRRRIERHLAEARLPPGKTLANFDFRAATPQGRGRMLQWPFYVANDVEPALIMLFRNRVFYPPEQRSATLADQAEETLRTKLAILEQQLVKNPFFGGDRWDMADFMVASVLYVLTRAVRVPGAPPTVPRPRPRCQPGPRKRLPIDSTQQPTTRRG